MPLTGAFMASVAKKLSITLILLTVIVFFVAYVGRQTIESSSVYEASRVEVQRKYGAKPEDLSIQLLSPFQFSDGITDGHAEFVLCERRVCYQISALKNAGTWRIDAATK